MFKRKDWLFTHGADGGGSDSSSSDDNSSRSEDHSGSSDSEADSQQPAAAPGASSSDEGGEPIAVAELASDYDQDAGPDLTRRLEDFSEDDFSEVDEEDEERAMELAALLSNWMEATKEQQLKGKAVKCRVCAGALILNATAFQQHATSKKHAKLLARAEAAERHWRKQRRGGVSDSSSSEDEDEGGLRRWRAFCFAEDYESASDEEGETHQERLQRLNAAVEAAKQRQAAAEAAAAAKKKARQERREQQRKKHAAAAAAAAAVAEAQGGGAEAGGKQPDGTTAGVSGQKKRPGKRQRQEMRDQGLWKTKQLKKQGQAAAQQAAVQEAAAPGPEQQAAAELRLAKQHGNKQAAQQNGSRHAATPKPAPAAQAEAKHRKTGKRKVQN